eukprot:scaffold9519_cov183-Amphora_coffeaeformis.AAC.9
MISPETPHLSYGNPYPNLLHDSSLQFAVHTEHCNSKERKVDKKRGPSSQPMQSNISGHQTDAENSTHFGLNNNVIIMQRYLGCHVSRDPSLANKEGAEPTSHFTYTEAVPELLPSFCPWPPSQVMGFNDPMNEEGACAAAFDEAAAVGTPSADDAALAAGASPAGGVAVACPTMACRGTMFGYC